MPDLLVKPYVKWAGGKRQLLPEIKKRLPRDLCNYTYYEPFVGAGAVFFEVQPKKALINDSNTQLILTYKVIRSNIQELVAALKVHSLYNNEAYFYRIRSLDRAPETFYALSDVEKAARFIYLNKTCYNGLYRVNSKGLFNVPYGRYVNPAICDEPSLSAVHAYLVNNDEIVILNGDFADAVKMADDRAFVYFDPPYHGAGNTHFTKYQADGFGAGEQARLRDTYAVLTDRGAKCLLSNADTDYIRELYSDKRFGIITVTAKRAINSDAAGRGNVNEVLIKNWK